MIAATDRASPISTDDGAEELGRLPGTSSALSSSRVRKVDPGTIRQQETGLLPNVAPLNTEENARVRSDVAPCRLLAEWNGYVARIGMPQNHFTAVLKGIVGDGIQGEEEDAVIPIDDVSDGDRELLREGNFFRLCVFHQVRSDGESRRFTQIVFRRLPAYRFDDLRSALERGRERAERIRVE